MVVHALDATQDTLDAEPPNLAQHTSDPMQSDGAEQSLMIPPQVAVGSWQRPVMESGLMQHFCGEVQGTVVGHKPPGGAASGFPLASAVTRGPESLLVPPSLLDELELHPMPNTTQNAVARQTVALVMNGSMVSQECSPLTTGGRRPPSCLIRVAHCQPLS
jgi:hypothetical protein